MKHCVTVLYSSFSELLAHALKALLVFIFQFRLVSNMTGTLGRKMSFTAFVVTGNKNGLAGECSLVLHYILCVYCSHCVIAVHHSGSS